MTRVRWVTLLAVLTALATGCSATGQRASVVDKATQFVTALDHHDGKKACGLLTANAKSSASGATGTPCDKAVLNVKEDATTIRGVQIWGDSAQVKIGADVLFLRRLRAGWLVNAAGCKPQPHAAYQCDVAG